MDNNTSKLKGYGKQQGASGTYIFNGIITQEEYNNTLTGMEARKVYDIMRRSDATVKAALQAVKLPLISLDYHVEPASDDPLDVEAAAFMEQELFKRNVNWFAFCREAFGMFDFGFSVFEKVLEVTDFEGKMRIGIAKLGSRKQRSIYYWQTKDGKPGVQQLLLGDANTAYGLVDIEADRLIIFTNEKEGDNYEGISLLRSCFKDWDVKDKLGLVNAIALEKMSIGVPVLTAPADASPDQIAKAEATIQEMRGNEKSFIRKPIGWQLEMLDMKAHSVKEVLPTIEYHNHQIMLSVLAQFLLLGSGKSASGSRATSEDHSKLFMQSEEAAVKNFVATVQEFLVKPLCDLNYANLPNGYPQLQSSRVADNNISLLAAAMNQLALAGLLTPDSELEEFIREEIHAPDLPDDIIANYAKYGSGKIPVAPQIGVSDTTPPAGEKPVAKDVKPTDMKASAIAAARSAKAQLIDILVRE